MKNNPKAVYGQMKRSGIKLLLGGLLLTALIYWRMPRERTVPVLDISSAQTVTLAIPHRFGGIDTLYIHVHGYIEGSADLSYVLGKRSYPMTNISGAVDYIWKADWYTYDAELKYEPHVVKRGALDITYHAD